MTNADNQRVVSHLLLSSVGFHHLHRVRNLFELWKIVVYVTNNHLYLQ